MQSLTMNSGLEIPQIGYGVFMMSGDEVRRHLPEAIDLGYRHIDTANAYFNEVAVGQAVRASGVDREDLFVTTKLFPQDYPATETMRGSRTTGISDGIFRCALLRSTCAS